MWDLPRHRSWEALVVAVPLGSRAEEAGLMPGDRLEAGDAMEIMAVFSPENVWFSEKKDHGNWRCSFSLSKSMVIFHTSVNLPEGKSYKIPFNHHKTPYNHMKPPFSHVFFWSVFLKIGFSCAQGASDVDFRWSRHAVARASWAIGNRRHWTRTSWNPWGKGVGTLPSPTKNTSSPQVCHIMPYHSHIIAMIVVCHCWRLCIS